MATIAETNSLFEIDAELDGLLDEIEEQTAQGIEPAEEIVARFQQFCSAHGEKVDRIGRFLRRMEAREQFCRAEVARLSDRARAAAGKVERTKNMVLYYLMSRDLKAIEGASSPCAPRRTARTQFGLPMRRRCQPPFVGSMPVSAASSGKQFLRIFPMSLPKCSRAQWKNQSRTRIRSRQLFSAKKKFPALTCGGAGT